RLQPRSQPDRAGLRQAQGPAPQSRTVDHRSHLEEDRTAPPPLHPNGVRQLPRQRRLCFKMKISCSSLAMAGREDDAQREMAAYVAVATEETLNDWALTVPYRDKANLDLFLDGLRKAGFPQ